MKGVGRWERRCHKRRWDDASPRSAATAGTRGIAVRCRCSLPETSAADSSPAPSYSTAMARSCTPSFRVFGLWGIRGVWSFFYLTFTIYVYFRVLSADDWIAKLIRNGFSYSKFLFVIQLSSNWVGGWCRTFTNWSMDLCTNKMLTHKTKKKPIKKYRW